jgi:hypothetical protein
MPARMPGKIILGNAFAALSASNEFFAWFLCCFLPLANSFLNFRGHFRRKRVDSSKKIGRLKILKVFKMSEKYFQFFILKALDFRVKLIELPEVNIVIWTVIASTTELKAHQEQCCPIFVIRFLFSGQREVRDNNFAQTEAK